MNTNPDDDILERSVQAIRQAPIPDGPDAKVVADTLAAIRLAAQKSNPFSRFLTMKTLSKMAAALVLAVGLALLMFVTLRSPSAGFADVIKKVRDAKYMSYVTTTKLPQAKEPVRNSVLASNDGKMRTQMQNGALVISDMTAGQVVTLQPSQKLAMVMSIKNAPANMEHADLIANFKKLGEKPDRELGEKIIDGKPARGFVVKSGNQEMEIWADKKTGDPVRVDANVPMGGQAVEVTFSDFNLNPQVPPNAFDLTVPQGYTVRQFEAPKGGVEEDVIELLRGHAIRADGAFPASLEDWGAFAKLVKPGANNAPAEEDIKWITHAGTLHAFLVAQNAAQGNGGWGYTGAAHKLGDKDTVVFWYKKPADQGAGIQYRAVFADLTARTVKKEELPK